MNETTLISKLRRALQIRDHQMGQLEQLAISQQDVLILASSVACAAMWDLVWANPGVELNFPCPTDAEVFEAFKKSQPPVKKADPSPIVKL